MFEYETRSIGGSESRERQGIQKFTGGAHMNLYYYLLNDQLFGIEKKKLKG